MLPFDKPTMKTKTSFLVAIMTTVALFLIYTLYGASHSPKAPQIAVPCHLALFPQYELPCETDRKTEIIITDLIRCESGGKEKAINEVDRDGTASYGLLQFKPSTLLGAIRQFKLMPDLEDGEIMNVMLIGDLQIRAFIGMYGGGKPVEWWAQQFPACSKKHKYWLNS